MTTLAGLVAQRLAHALAGPVGAIATAVDMLGTADDANLRALIADSAAATVATLRLHRFVLAPPDGPTDDARGLLAAWLAGREGPTLDWRAGELDGARAALLLGLAMCAAEAAPRGGTLRVDDDGVALAGPHRLAGEVAAALGGARPTTARAALAGLLHAAAAAAGTRIEVPAGADRLRLSLYQGSELPR